MPRLRNTLTGSVVNVDEETAGNLPSEWEPVKAPKTTSKASKAE